MSPDQTMPSSWPHVIRDLTKALTGHSRLPEFLPRVFEQLDAVLEPNDFALLLLWDQEEGALRVRAARGETIRDSGQLESLRLQGGEGISGKVHETGESVILASPDQVPEWMKSLRGEDRAAIVDAFGGKFHPRRVMALPLAVGQRRLGVALFGSLGVSSFCSQGSLVYLESLAGLLSLAIDRSDLEERASASHEAGLSGKLQAEALATLSHELRTPLAAIKGYSTAMLLEEVDWPDEKRRDFLRLIDDECNDLEIMINDILDSALIDIDQLSLEPQPIRLEKLAREIADDMQARATDHHLIIDFPANLPILDADPRRIKQVVRNILDNAIKYSPNGGLVVIRGELRERDVVVSIADQGVGISPEDLIPLFDRYFRVKAPTGYYVAGTGLGLPVARAIVEEHGGRIWAQSKVGEGTTLSFSLPLGDLARSDPDMDLSVPTLPRKEGER